MKKFLTFSASYAALALSTLAAAQAQSIDYSTMEELFQEPVTTSANGSPQRTSEVALNMEILTADKIKRTGARSIPEALRHVPGVDVRQITLGQYEVGIRGYNQGYSERILVLLNGRQVYLDFFGAVAWDNIPVEMGEIKQIEVVKGPNTALFGFNAVSGVINIITYNPLYDDKSSIAVAGGSHGLKELSGSVSKKITDKIAVRVSAGGHERDGDFSDIENHTNSVGTANNVLNHEKTDRSSILVDTWMQVTDNVQAQVEVSQVENQRNERIVTAVLSGTTYDTKTVRGRVIADTSAGLIEADVFHTNTEADIGLNVFAGVGVPLYIDNTLTVAKLSDTFQVGTDHTFRLAGEYREGTNFVSTASFATGQETVFAISGDDLRYEIMSISGLWDWKATDTIRTSLAVRYDEFELSPDGAYVSGTTNSNISSNNPASDSDYNQEREEVSYNFGVAYQPDDINTYRFTTASGADLPSFTEFGFQNHTGFAGIFGTPDVDTSTVTNYEIGYDRKIPEINGLFRTAVFYQYSNEMQFASNPTSTVGFYENIGDSEMAGIELGLEGVYQDRWTWGANYTYIDINDDLDNKQNSAERSSNVDYEEGVSNHTINAKLGYTGDKWYADGMLQYRSSYKEAVAVGTSTTQFTLNDVDDQYLLNASFGMNLSDNVDWSVSGIIGLNDVNQSAISETENQVWSTIKVNF